MRGHNARKGWAKGQVKEKHTAQVTHKVQHQESVRHWEDVALGSNTLGKKVIRGTQVQYIKAEQEIGEEHRWRRGVTKSPEMARLNQCWPQAPIQSLAQTLLSFNAVRSLYRLSVV